MAFRLQSKFAFIATTVILLLTPKLIVSSNDNQANKSSLRRNNNPTDDNTATSSQWHEDPVLSRFIDEETHIPISTLLETTDLKNSDPSVAASSALHTITSSIHDRLTHLYTKAKTPQCRAKIAQHFNYFLAAIGTESRFPYENAKFKNECDEEKYDFEDLPEGVTIGTIQNRTYQPPPSEDAIYVDYKDLSLCYGILTHDNPHATIRLIESLHEPSQNHSFVIHVDAKPSSDTAYATLWQYAQTHPHVHILPASHRVRVNWGGFSMVNATLQLLRYALAVEDPLRSPLVFHKFVHVASTSYPLRGNLAIRQKIASYPLDANFMTVVFKPTDPHPMSWHYFVECDDVVHRIFRLTPLNEEENGIDIYTASQWFIISLDFARYLALAPPKSLVKEFIDYAQHVVVADESFFGTVLRHTAPFCHKHHNDNFLHVQFDRWENELDVVEDRDERKCLMPNPDHCGRSPTTMTLDYLPILELSGSLFARKFMDGVDSDIKDVIDAKRAKEDARLQAAELGETFDDPEHFDTSFEGHGTLIVAKETLYDDIPLCLGLGPNQNKVRLTPCFVDGIRETLAPGWETGAVILPETLPHNRWDLGPCSTDGTLERQSNGTLLVTPGQFSQSGPRCNLKQKDGLRTGRCMDGESDRVQPGGEIQVFPCVGRWHQLFSFGGSGAGPMSGSIHTNVPLHVRNTIQRKGREQVEFMCVGVLGRGGMDEQEWNEDEEEEDEETVTQTERRLDDEALSQLPPLSKWIDEQLVTTRCDNVGAIIEWLFIPFVDSEEAEYEIFDGEGAASKEGGADEEEDEEL